MGGRVRGSVLYISKWRVSGGSACGVVSFYVTLFRDLHLLRCRPH